MHSIPKHALSKLNTPHVRTFAKHHFALVVTTSTKNTLTIFAREQPLHKKHTYRTTPRKPCTNFADIAVTIASIDVTFIFLLFVGTIINIFNSDEDRDYNGFFMLYILWLHFFFSFLSFLPQCTNGKPVGTR